MLLVDEKGYRMIATVEVGIDYAVKIEVNGETVALVTLPDGNIDEIDFDLIKLYGEAITIDGIEGVNTINYERLLCEG